MQGGLLVFIETSKDKSDMKGIDVKTFWNTLILGISAIYIVSSLLPSWTADYWWVRIWDFPRAQMATLGLLCLILLLTTHNRTWIKLLFALILCIALVVDAYRIYPYTFLKPIEVHASSLEDKNSQISILEANVLQSNTNYSALKNLIKERSPDIIFLVEVNQKWVDSMKEFEATYPHHLLHPLSNTYGLAFYSRLPFRNGKVNFHIDPDIPSVEAEVLLRSGAPIQIYGLHPRPPKPQNEMSSERDAELIKIAKLAVDSQKPVIVMGDLNDVAWSHTTRLFRRVSRLLDPRVGRGFFSTFPAGYGVFRFPIDYVFISDEFRLVDIQRLPDIESDHFPLWVTFSHEPQQAETQEAPKLEEGDKGEAQKILEKGK